MADVLDELAGASAAPQAPVEHCTDLGNAERLARRHGKDLRFNFDTGRWMSWDEKRFRDSALAEVHRHAKETIRALLAEAAAIENEATRKRLAGHAISSESRGKQEAMVDLARHEPGIGVRAADLDANPWLLNVDNGTIDLRTGRLSPHSRDALITKLASVKYEPAAACPLFLAFLDRAMAGDRDLIAFLQRGVGYSLTGDVSEQVLFFLHGKGANGKSTFCVTILAAAGDYAKQMAPDLLLAKKGESHPTDQADLQGVRLAVGQEVEQGRALAEVAVKQLTGGDRVRARFMRQDFFEFEPHHKLWLCANHKPTVRGTDHAIWRRILLVPFTVTIPKPEQDRKLTEKLKAELPGILAWAVRGCLDWQRQGLQPPAQVCAATQAYRAESDTIGRFLDETCLMSKSDEVSAEDLHAAFKAWCESSGERLISKKAMGDYLADRDDFQRRKSGRVFWRGLRLRTCADDRADDHDSPVKPIENASREDKPGNGNNPPNTPVLPFGRPQKPDEYDAEERRAIQEESEL